MECELCGTERAEHPIEVWGMLRHVCESCRGSAPHIREGEPVPRYPLAEVVEIIRTFERLEHYPGTDAYDIALSAYRHAESIVPVTFAKAMEVVMSDPPVRVGPETRDIEKPF